MSQTLYRVNTGQFVYSRLKAFEGAFGLANSEHEGSFVSNEFPTFQADSERLNVRYLAAFFRSPAAWRYAATLSTGIGARRERLQPEQFLKLTIPLPSLTEQQRLVDQIAKLEAKIDTAQRVTAEIDKQNELLLTAAFCDVSRNAIRRRLGDIASLTRRPAMVDPLQSYPGVSVRSFGRGTFHNPPLPGSEITWEKPFQVRAGDILVSNIKAWEGAIAVATPEDDGRYGSHRYLTYTPLPGVAAARFVCFFLLTKEGLYHVGEASPGSADRNRTTSAKALLEIPVPVPDIKQQEWFGKLYDKVEEVKKHQLETTTGRKVLFPAILDRAFRGVL